MAAGALSLVIDSGLKSFTDCHCKVTGKRRPPELRCTPPLAATICH